MDEQLHDDVRWCPQQWELTQAVDGILREPRGRRIRQHVRACKACQERRGHIDGLYVDLKPMMVVDGDPALEVIRDRIQAFLPVPATLGPGFQQKFREQRERQRRVAFAPAVSSLGARLRLATAAAVFVIVGTQIVPRVSVRLEQPDVLLTHASARERSQPAGWRQRVRINFAPPGLMAASRASAGSAVAFTKVHDAEAWPTSALRHADSGLRARVPADVAHVLDTYHFDWARPLSVTFVNRWRESLADKREHVTWLSGHALLVLRTTTRDGLLREVNVTMRSQTHQIVAQTFVFDGVGRLELEEIGTSIVPVPAALAAGLSADAETTAIDPDALKLAEIEARIVLRDEEEDLSEDLRIALTSTAVEVHARLPRRVVSRLQNVRHVAVVRPAKGTQAARQSDAALPPNARLARRVDYRLKDRTDQAEMFAADVLQRMALVTRRLAMLQALAVRYPVHEIQGMASGASGRLTRLVNLHYDSLQRDVDGLSQPMMVLYGPRGLSTVPFGAPSDWRQRTATGAGLAESLGTLLRQPPPDEEALDGPSGTPDPIPEQFDRLWQTINTPPGPAPPSAS